MNDEKLKALLKALQSELKHIDELDADTLAIAKQLDSDINQLIDREVESPAVEGIVEKANELGAQFATNHPLLERTLREVVEVLAKMGI